MADAAGAPDGASPEPGAAVSSKTRPGDEVYRGLKRPAEDDVDDDSYCRREAAENGHQNGSKHQRTATEPPGMSKNQLRKLRRQKLWDERRKEKKTIRKEKRHLKQERKRLDREAEIAAATAEGREPIFSIQSRRKSNFVAQVPVTVIIDCQFEKYMMEKELTSLGNQVTRCYSDNRNAEYPVHVFVSSYGGKMRERHETILENQHKQWKHMHFVEGDFLSAAAEAKILMEGPTGGTVIDLLAPSEDGDGISLPQPSSDTKKQRAAPVPEPEADDVDKSIVYLTADSPYTLDRLEPNTCYVIGGLIDKNREKGLCYKIARQKKVRTAKLPIGEFMVMQSRHVLATNHVMEIILRWLETGDWGAAFMKVIPTRKGGKLKEDDNNPDEAGEEAAQVPQKDEQDVSEGGGVATAGENIETVSSTIDDREPEHSGAVEVEGSNAEESLEKNALGQQRWSAPPPEPEDLNLPGGAAAD
ncbi:tRNA-methyltransferase-domain-containing protein [Durotheca rogersii]|uniref:tRNA-methyltransferase-domain-containing protein n=1 Tax=Durotheca rogersii TaxID=419775 RepID=UPI00221FE916|nr:tRNA-methyltransferase-domain-containing protein [Durotheca rogersii]KAI5863891.1 tRNA-methyltransferase-domain-containing protein [Durotheca rogersii]